MAQRPSTLPPAPARGYVPNHDDANRALVWWIRFEALKAWCDRTDVIARLNSGSVTLRDACDVAASFPLNHLWEFEPNDFCSATEAVTVRRAQAGADR